ncbi:haloacid dehalogenase-like hydrolase [Aggregicoccus sp. 17bor-14]|uniref:HAD family hydrolase n=1 Tax=Myxococcaceae TaxID=31 RepID=UPI00129C3AF3|nr:MULTISPECIES: HAD family hydrolase [Myxococcaceae]MBF5044605.1 hypothetical protein [Simulacricoccus sp. 17bor-14]MRI90349.1 haloacid dehalogenase-like hydrolase [Aggregicoccus sp. 17bor-14]
MPRTRVVGSFWSAGEPLSFRELCERAVPPDTRLLVLDLDRTLHLGRNMGELLGWEINAYQAYGAAYLRDLEPQRTAGRFYLERTRPLAALRYLWSAVRVWGLPGLSYLLWGKVAARLGLVRRRSFLRFGPEPVQAVQRVPQYALFRQMASVPEPLVRELAARVWARYRQDLILEREDVAWLRERCPGIRIVLSSASPQQVVEAAGEALGIEEVIGSSLHRINGGRAKLEELRARYPGLLDAPGVTTVGMSDTGYGEDHSWVEAFTHLVDVNSSTGFPPIVSSASPLQALYSAHILTRAEKEARARGEQWLDPRRGRAGRRHGRELRASELEALLAPLRSAVERLARELELRQRQLADVLERAREELAAMDAALEHAAESFVVAQREHVRELRDRVEARLSAQRALARSARPVSEVAFAMAQALERSRLLLERRAHA